MIQLMFPSCVLLMLVNFPPLNNAGGTRFASCFICNERGHLSKDCPKNTHGVYPKVLIVDVTTFCVRICRLPMFWALFSCRVAVVKFVVVLHIWLKIVPIKAKDGQMLIESLLKNVSCLCRDSFSSIIWSTIKNSFPCITQNLRVQCLFHTLYQT